MSILGSIFSKILGHHDAPSGAGPAPTIVSDPAPVPSAAGAPVPPVAAGPATASPPVPAGGTPVGVGTAPAAAAPVDVAAMLDGLAAKSSQTLDWKHSIVDMMKLIGIDSSLSARQALAKELHYSGDMHDSASMNVWLHSQVMRELAENGGKVPDDLRH